MGTECESRIPRILDNSQHIYTKQSKKEKKRRKTRPSEQTNSQLPATSVSKEAGSIQQARATRLHFYSQKYSTANIATIGEAYTRRTYRATVDIQNLADAVTIYLSDTLVYVMSRCLGSNKTHHFQWGNHMEDEVHRQHSHSGTTSGPPLIPLDKHSKYWLDWSHKHSKH